MPLIPEVQRLLARGPRSLPGLLVVDCAGIARWVAETDPEADPWPLLVEAGRRSHRVLCWLTGPTALAHDSTEPNEMAALNQRLAALLPGLVGWSNEPAGAVVAAVAAHCRVGLVTAGVEQHYDELWVLSHGAVVLDVADGRLWTSEAALQAFGPPGRLPLIAAMLAPEPGGKPVIKELARYPDAVHDGYRHVPESVALGIAHAVDRGLVPERPVDILLRSIPAVEEEAARRRGDGRDDSAARAWVTSSQPTATAPSGTGTLYVAAAVKAGQLERVVTLGHGAADGHADSLSLLRNLSTAHGGRRWFVPHALDVLDVMVDASIRLPGHVVDPALGAFILHPDEPPPLEDLLLDLHAVPPLVRSWLADVRREAGSLSPDLLLDVVDLLPALDQALDGRLRQSGLHAVLENDVALTLPALAIIERQGIWVGNPPGGWGAELQRHQQQLQPALQRAARFLHKDPLRVDLGEVVWRLQQQPHGQLPTTHLCTGLTPAQLFERYVELKNADAIAISDVRSALSDQAALRWLRTLADGATVLRGSLSPSTTGRWYYHNLPLGSLPKHSPSGASLRQHLVPPPGMHLVAADWNAFEARLLASITGDPVLTQVAQAPDFHAALAQLMGVTRDGAKAVIYAVVYGQQRSGFVASQAGMTVAAATALYNGLLRTVPAAGTYRHGVAQHLQIHGDVRTHNGWRRIPVSPSPQKRILAAASLCIQGLGADVLRWVLRELTLKLPTHGAYLAHQLHDEVVAACLPAAVPDVKLLLEQTMNAGVNAAGLLPNPVPLPVDIKDGTTWQAIS